MSSVGKAPVWLTAMVMAWVIGALVSSPMAEASVFGPRGAQYVSIGDSYIAAGSIPTSLNCNAVDDVGHLVAAQLPDVSFADWSCSGSTTTDISAAGSHPAQIGGLSANTRYVSVSTGGNDDSLFGDVVARCLIAVTCTPAVKAQADRKLDHLAVRLDSAYSAIRAHAPRARVVVLGYSRILPDSAAGCFVNPVMGQGALDFSNRLQYRLNTIIGAVARRHGFIAVGLWDDGGHSLCAPDGQRYVSLTGVGPGDYGTPVHPTLAGRLHAAGLITHAFTTTS